MADVPQVTVTAVTLACIERKVDAVCLTIFDLFFTGRHVPEFVHSPRSDNLEVRSKCLDTKLKTDLVVTLTGSAVADSSSAFLTSDFYKTLCDARTSHGSTKQVFVLVYGICLYTGNYIFIYEFVSQVLDVQLSSAGVLRTLLKTVKLVALTYIDTAANYIVIEVFF